MPQAVWFNGWHSDMPAAVRSVVAAARSEGRLPVLVAYNIPQRDCGSYSAGGASSETAYRSWIRSFADAIGADEAIVVLEPDAIAGWDCLSSDDRLRRQTLLRDAVDVLKAKRGTRVYMDGGHAAWHSATEMSNRLIVAGIERADGFAVNVSNFVATDLNVAFGNAVSDKVGGRGYVIDTSRNGRGAAPANAWCNPDGRGTGELPTTTTGHARVDAFLWIKRPGESDGPCNGGPAAGKWWAEYALGLMQRSSM